MLNHLLAGVVALSSLVLFLSGFFFPEVQRKPDLAWSGVALLYGLLLFVEGDHTSGGALLGHIASVALILWFGWQTLQQRRQFVSPDTQTQIPGSLDALMPFLKEGWGRILVTYGEASTWVKDQLGKGDENITEIKTPPAPLQEVDDESWDSQASASPATESSSTTDPIEEEAVKEIVHTSPEVLVDAPSTIEPVTLLVEVTPLPPAPEPPPSEPQDIAEVTPTAGISIEEVSDSDLNLKTATTFVSHDHPEEGRMTETTSIAELAQSITSEEKVDDNISDVIRENDDGSWPPQDLIS